MGAHFMLQPRSWFWPLSNCPIEPLRCCLLSLGDGHEAAGISRRTGWCGGNVAGGGTGAAARADAAHWCAEFARCGRSAVAGRMTAFVQALQQHGWTEGRNVTIETRWGGGDSERLRRHARELVALSPNVILAVTVSSMAPLQQATRTVPIVFVQVTDAVGAGFVESLSRPGGNATGFSLSEYGFSAKWLGLLRQIAPRITRAGVLRDPSKVLHQH
jgi:ABC transporter substrate binding protein